MTKKTELISDIIAENEKSIRRFQEELWVKVEEYAMDLLLHNEEISDEENVALLEELMNRIINGDGGYN